MPIVLIRPSAGWAPINLREILAYRELLNTFILRDIMVRYKQTALGVAWVVIQPLFAMIIFTIFFGGLAKIPSEGVPYPLFSYSALLPWTLFAEGLTRSTYSMVGNASILTKVYFPRLIMPLSGVISPLIDFAISFTIYLGLMLYFRYIPTTKIIFLPAFILLALGTALGVGLWLSAMNVQYRDIGYTVPFLVQIWLYASPVVYPSSLVPEQYQMIYALNPMVGVIEGFRWALLGTTPPSSMIAVSVLVVLLLLISGSYYFRRIEKNFADVV